MVGAALAPQLAGNPPGTRQSLMARQPARPTLTDGSFLGAHVTPDITHLPRHPWTCLITDLVRHQDSPGPPCGLSRPDPDFVTRDGHPPVHLADESERLRTPADHVSPTRPPTPLFNIRPSLVSPPPPLPVGGTVQRFGGRSASATASRKPTGDSTVQWHDSLCGCTRDPRHHPPLPPPVDMLPDLVRRQDSPDSPADSQDQTLTL